MGIARDIQRRLAAVPTFSGKRCAVCGKRVGRFLPYRGGSRCVPPLMIALDCIGSDVDHFECPRCGAHDRERHLWLYLQASGLLDALAGMRILHFAPERQLTTLVAGARPMRYVRCDKHPTSDEIQGVDIEAIPFADRSFDLLIANHVLEHVDDDLQAIREITRVLDVGGHAILQTPYSVMLEWTWGDPGIATETARNQAYGQEDHVRLFGRDIFTRITDQGLVSCVTTHAELLPKHAPDVYGVNPREPFFLFRRDS